jgi:hypothetical protein
MNAWPRLLMQVLLRHRAQGRAWATWAMLAALLLPLAGAATGMLALPVAGMVAAGIVSGIILLWWSEFVQTAMRMNTPAAACLVPGLRRRVMVLAAALWFIGALPPGLLFGAATGHFGYCLLTSAAGLQFVAVCGRYPWLAFAPSLVWLASLLPARPRTTLGATFGAMRGALGETELALGGCVVLALSGAAVLRALFPRGGDAHYGIAACLERQVRQRREGRRAPPGDWLYRVLDGVYRARLAAPGTSATRLLDAMGARAHWGGPVLILATLAVSALAWRALADAGAMRPFIPLLLVSMMLVVVTHVDGLLGAIRRSRTEQAILRLVPLAPRPRDLNRALAHAVLARFGIVWGTYLACSLAVVLATTGAWRAWLCCTALTLVFAPLLLRDHARHPGWAGAQVAAGALLLVMMPLAGVAEFGGIPLAVIVACVTALLAGTAIAFALRWRRALAAPPAFPAGRMAS